MTRRDDLKKKPVSKAFKTSNAEHWPLINLVRDLTSFLVEKKFEDDFQIRQYFIKTLANSKTTLK